MDAKELLLIKELMDQLQKEMMLDKNDLSRRLGREEKPKGIEIVKVEKSALEPEMEEKEDDSLEHELSEALGAEEEDEEELELPVSSDEKLKRRLMKLRG